MDRQNNYITGLTDSQLEETLTEMFFNPSFGGAPEVMNGGIGESTVTSSANGDAAPLPVALHVAETMPNPFVGIGGTLLTSMSTNALMGNQTIVQNAPPGGMSGNRTLPTGAFAPPPPASRDSNPPSTTTFTGRPQLFGKELPFEVPLPPSGGMSGVPKSEVNTTTGTEGKRKRDPSAYAVSEDESERERRRQDRNFREQQRSQQISNQIVVLRRLLSDANVESKPDKYSTLASVVEYVKALQQKSSILDSEHKKLLETITQTTKIMNSQYMMVQSDVTSNKGIKGDVVSSVPEDESQVFVQGIDYRSIFRASPFALATTSIDGRFLDCSEGFEKITKFSREELLPAEKETRPNLSNDDSSSTTSDISSGIGSSGDSAQPAVKNLSLFNVMDQRDMGKVYHAMFDILQQRRDQGEEDSSNEESVEEKTFGDQWSNDVRLSRDEENQVKLYLNLVRTLQQRPRFFNCTLLSDDSPKPKPDPMVA